MSNCSDKALALDHIHCRAICDEIGERLRDVLGRERPEIPPRLLVLIEALARSEHAPSMVPSLEEMSYPLCSEPFGRAKRSADVAPSATNRELISVGL